MVDSFRSTSGFMRNPREDSGTSSKKPEYLQVKMNSNPKESSKHKNKAPSITKVSVGKKTETIEQYVHDDLVKKHMTNSKSYPNGKLYSCRGMVLNDSDLYLLETGDVVYFARHGEPFNYQ